MADDDELLGAWLDRVGRVAKTDTSPEERDFKSVALELGLTETDLARVEAAVDDHATRGRNFLAHGRPDDAVIELERAHALAPWRDDVSFALAEALVARYHHEGADADRNAAEGLIRARLERQPDHQPAYTLLNALDGPPPSAGVPVATGGQASRKEAQKKMLLLAGAGISVMFLLLGVLTVLVPVAVEDAKTPGNSEVVVIEGTDPAPAPKPVEPPPAPEPVEPAPKPATPPSTASTDDGADLPTGKHPLPVEIVADDRFAGITIDPTGTRIDRGTTYTSAWMKLRVQNGTPDRAIDDLYARIEFLDRADAVVTEKTVELLNSAYSTLYPGEQMPKGESIRTKRAVVKARITLNQIEAVTAGTLPAPKAVCIKWGMDEPEHLGVEIGLRTSSWNGIALNQDFVVRNTSAGVVKSLELQVEHYDAAGALLETPNIMDKETIATSWLPPFEPGETRLAHHMNVMARPIKDRYDHTCVRIQKLD